MLRLGGSVLGHASPELTHAGDNYQESLADLLQMFQSYADIIVIRHPKTGVLEDVAPSAAIPVINCGDGMGEHPTQLLIDAYTLLCRFGTLSNLHIACVGDMRMRVFHSLFCLARTFDWTLELCPPPHSEVPQEWMDFLDKNQLRYSLHNNLCPAIKTADVIYVDSVLPHEHSLGQYASNDYIEEVVSRYQITPELLQNHARNDIVVLHPLPRGPELPQSLDATKFNLYWNQASNAVPIRMAVLEKLLCQNLSYDSDTRIGPLA
jgi:aspartate carbamoyltransferase catalytic subunit